MVVFGLFPIFRSSCSVVVVLVGGVGVPFVVVGR